MPLKGSILVTGANGGLGCGFVSNLLKSAYSKEYRGVYTVRDPSKANDLNSLLAKAPKGHTSEVLAFDLGGLENIREFAEEINKRVADGTLEPIRALVLNAGWQEANSETLRPKTFTPDGYEAAFAINYLANFVFTLLILGSMDKEHGRIVLVSSYTHDPYNPNSASFFAAGEYKTVFKDTESLANGIEYHDDGQKAGMRRYGNSKTLLVMWMYELQRRIDLDHTLSKISVLAMDPGGMGGTGIVRAWPWYQRILIVYVLAVLQVVWVRISPNGVLRTPYKSGGDLLQACFEEKKLGERPKAVYLDGSEKAESSSESRDEKKQKQLWVETLKLARIREGDTALSDWK